MRPEPSPDHVELPAGGAGLSLRELQGLADRMSRGAASCADQVYVGRALLAWLSAAGAVDMERCLRLPNTDDRRQRALRDEHLRSAWHRPELAELKGMPRAERLVQEWHRLVLLSCYARWREQGEPEAQTSPLHQDLFWASTYNRHEVLGARMVWNIARG